MKIGIVVARFNERVTDQLLRGALDVLHDAGVPDEAIQVVRVPGSFEIPWAVAELVERTAPDGVIVLGAIIQGETEHHRYLADAVFHALAQFSMTHKIPIGLGILTTATLAQALERSGGKFGNKGRDAAESVLACIRIRNRGQGTSP